MEEARTLKGHNKNNVNSFLNRVQMKRIWNTFCEDINKNKGVKEMTFEKEIVKGFLQVSLKRKDYDSKNILMLQKLIPQKLIFALQFEEQTQFCIFHTRLQQTVWMQTGEAAITLQGLTLDDVWNNIVATIGGLDVQAEESIEEQIIQREQREKLLRQIEQLEKRCRLEKQTRKKFELHQQITKLKEQL